MIREIGSVYSKVEYVKERTYVKLGDKEFAVDNDWVKIMYKVTKEGDEIVGITIPTDYEIKQEMKVQGIVELDKMVQESLDDAKKEWKKLKRNVKNKVKELKEKIKR